MKKIIAAVLATTFALGCGEGKSTPAAPPPPARPLGPGGSVSLAAIGAAVLGCSSTLTWAVVEGNGGTITPTGVYTAPACGPSFAEGTYHVTVSGCDRSATLALDVVEGIASVAVCGVPPGGTTCQPSVSLAPGETASFYAKVTKTCGSFSWVPSVPPGLAP